MLKQTPAVVVQAVPRPDCPSPRQFRNLCTLECPQVSKWLPRATVFGCEEGSLTFKALLEALLKCDDDLIKRICRFCLAPGPGVTTKDEWLDSLDCECLCFFGSIQGFSCRQCVIIPYSFYQCFDLSCPVTVCGCDGDEKYWKSTPVCSGGFPEVRWLLDPSDPDADKTEYKRLLHLFLKWRAKEPSICNVHELLEDVTQETWQVIYSANGELGVLPSVPFDVDLFFLFSFVQKWVKRDVALCVLTPQ